LKKLARTARGAGTNIQHATPINREQTSNSDPVILTNYRPTPTRLTRAPVLGLLDLFQTVELADFFQAFVNQLPGAWTVGVDFASVLARAAARTVHHFLRTPRDGADAAGLATNKG